MIFTCSSDILINKLKNVYVILPTKQEADAINGVKFIAKGDHLHLYTSDHKCSLSVTLQAGVLQEGEVILPGKFLRDFLKDVKETVRFESVDGSLCKVSYSDNKVDFNCLELDLLSIENTVPYETTLQIKYSDLKDLLLKTSLAADLQEKNALLSACFLTKNGNILSCVATDAYKMSYAYKNINSDCADFKASLPIKSVEKLLKLEFEDNAIITLCISDKKFAIKSDSLDFSSVLAQDSPYDFKNNIDIINSYTSSFTITREDLSNVVRRLIAVSEQADHNVCSLTIESKSETSEKLVIAFSNRFVKNINENIEIGLNGKDASLNVYLNHLDTALKCLTGEFLKFSYESSQRPIFIQSLLKNKEGEKENRVDDIIFLCVPSRSAK